MDWSSQTLASSQLHGNAAAQMRSTRWIVAGERNVEHSTRWPDSTVQRGQTRRLRCDFLIGPGTSVDLRALRFSKCSRLSMCLIAQSNRLASLLTDKLGERRKQLALAARVAPRLLPV